MNAEQEQEWIAIARGDLQAFKRLYDHYSPKLYAYISYRVGKTQDTEDLVAETFLKAIENIDEFEWRHTSSFAAWIFSIAHNLVLNFHLLHPSGQHVPSVRSLVSATIGRTPSYYTEAKAMANHALIPGVKAVLRISVVVATSSVGADGQHSADAPPGNDRGCARSTRGIGCLVGIFVRATDSIASFGC
ncbi:MAG: RNA polymerase sigma factor [Roseiflexus sp.]|nr:RNA polymerase sigma factor [Roseiflexus sp.]MCS7289268.1 RNA polymerase sigma factor [Roseiflexus sp.]MDW8148121.1 sigma factor [Roseiflexaceae bacterium]MDW8232470.1 sigma factor [Roseiflexaceae bacterium]